MISSIRTANKIIDRLRKGRNALEKSGVVWHTQGSGKSLTMVFVARMLRASKDLNDYKILLINDQARHATSRNSGTPVTLIRSPTQRMGDALNALRP